MNYQTLYRKFRPKLFSEIIGQDHILIAIRNILSSKKIHQSYIFSGMYGTGKTTIGRLLSKSLNCDSGITYLPCRKCKNCTAIEENNFIDLIEIDAASKTKVEDIRGVLENVQYMPTNGRFKIYLIDEAHMLSRYSFNALLKTLEEPPEYTKFFLVTTNPKKLPKTILSRCFRLHLNKIDPDQISRHLTNILKKEKITFETNAINLLAKASHGSMRDSLNLIEKASLIGNNRITIDLVKNMLEITEKEQAINLIESLIKKDSQLLSNQIEQCENSDINWENLLREIIEQLYHIAILQSFPNLSGRLEKEIEKDLLNRLKQCATNVSSNDIQKYYEIFLIGKKDIPLTTNPKMGVEMILLQALSYSS